VDHLLSHRRLGRQEVFLHLLSLGHEASQLTEVGWIGLTL